MSGTKVLIVGVARSIHGPDWQVYSQTSSCSVTNCIYDDPCTVEKLHPVLLGPRQVQSQTSRAGPDANFVLFCSHESHFLITLTPLVISGWRPRARSAPRLLSLAASGDQSSKPQRRSPLPALRVYYCDAAQLRPASRATTAAAIDLLYRIHGHLIYCWLSI